MKNPNWTRDELILALDLYFRVDINKTNARSQEVIELSSLLNRLPIHASNDRGEEFRNPSGVYMKMCNFLTLDPSYNGKGLGNFAIQDGLVWQEFADRKEELHQISKAIVAGITQVHSPVDDHELSVEKIEEFPEGRVLTKMHFYRERNQTLVTRKKNKHLEIYGYLACEACGFDFEKAYGEHGSGFIECHHRLPLSMLAEPVKSTKLEDLAIVCANCHRMLHRSRPWKTIEELKQILISNGAIST